jgi:hypothetical protein
MDLFFKDYRGRTIRFSEERIRHIEAHFEMTNFEDHIRETLLTPQKVIRSRRDQEASLYYRYYFGTRIGDKWLCIVVKDDEEEPFCLTSYFTNKIKKGKVIWTNT